MSINTRPLLHGAAIIAVMGFEIIARASGIAVFNTLAHAALLLVVLLTLPRCGLREAYLLTLCALLTAAVMLYADDPAHALHLGFEQAAFLMAFIFLLALLNETALSSPSVATCGAYLTGQPPGKRYAALYWGTNMMTVMFNLGAVSLFSPLIKRGVEASDADAAGKRARERRQYSAVMRGFAWNLVWSPTAIAPIAVMGLIDGIDRQRWTLLGLGFAAAIFVVGAMEDHWRFSKLARSAKPRPRPAFPLVAYARFSAAVLWLIALTLAFIWLTGGTLILSLMIACPLMMLGWLAAQNGIGRFAKTRAQIHSIGFQRLPEIATVAVALGCSGYIGRLGAALIPAEEWAQALGVFAMPQYMLLTALPVFMLMLSFFAVSPIMLAVFFGSVFGALPVLPTDPTLLALSLSIGWALAMTASPFATVVLLLAKMTGHSGMTLTLRWNGFFSVLSVAVFGLAFWLLTGGR